MDYLEDIILAIDENVGTPGKDGVPGKTPKIGAGKGAPSNDEYAMYIDTDTGDLWLNS